MLDYQALCLEKLYEMSTKTLLVSYKETITSSCFEEFLEKQQTLFQFHRH